MLRDRDREANQGVAANRSTPPNLDSPGHRWLHRGPFGRSQKLSNSFCDCRTYCHKRIRLGPMPATSVRAWGPIAKTIGADAGDYDGSLAAGSNVGVNDDVGPDSGCRCAAPVLSGLGAHLARSVGRLDDGSLAPRPQEARGARNVRAVYRQTIELATAGNVSCSSIEKYRRSVGKTASRRRP